MGRRWLSPKLQINSRNATDPKQFLSGRLKSPDRKNQHAYCQKTSDVLVRPGRSNRNQGAAKPPEGSVEMSHQIHAKAPTDPLSRIPRAPALMLSLARQGNLPVQTRIELCLAAYLHTLKLPAQLMVANTALAESRYPEAHRLLNDTPRPGAGGARSTSGSWGTSTERSVHAFRVSSVPYQRGSSRHWMAGKGPTVTCSPVCVGVVVARPGVSSTRWSTYTCPADMDGRRRQTRSWPCSSASISS